MTSTSKAEHTSNEIDSFLSDLVTMKVNGRQVITIVEVQDRLLDIRNELLAKGYYSKE